MTIENLIQRSIRRVFNDDTLRFDKSRFAGGLTNYNYIMAIHGHDYVIRQPGGMTEKMINRYTELENGKRTTSLGINCPYLYFDPDTGIKITNYIPHSKNLAQCNPRSNKNINIVLSLLKQLHHMQESFSNQFNWILELQKYETIIQDLHGETSMDYEEIKRYLEGLYNNYLNNENLVPCHNDPVPENFLTSPSGTSYLIDWEYSGMNSIYWDIAAYILESQLPEKAIYYLLETYFNRHITNNELFKIKIYILAQDLLWTTWALVRHYNGDDFLDYYVFRYERLKRNIRQLKSNTTFPLYKFV